MKTQLIDGMKSIWRLSVCPVEAGSESRHPCCDTQETVSQSAKKISGRPMAERFFRAAALAGELHLIDLSDWDDWELGKVQYRDDAEVSWLMRTGAGERRVVRTAAELDAAIENSASPRGIYLYVSENLAQEAKRRWEETTRKRKQ